MPAVLLSLLEGKCRIPDPDDASADRPDPWESVEHQVMSCQSVSLWSDPARSTAENAVFLIARGKVTC